MDAAGRQEGFLPVVAPASLLPEPHRRALRLRGGRAARHRRGAGARSTGRSSTRASTSRSTTPTSRSCTTSSCPPARWTDYRAWAQPRIDALNHALEGIPQDRSATTSAGAAGTARTPTTSRCATSSTSCSRSTPAPTCFEHANPRHEHEWRVWEDVELPAGKMLAPGVISHATNVVEHPELVAERLERIARLVGAEHVIASTDCGFAQGPYIQRVHPTIQWAKLHSLAEGAELASRALDRRALAPRAPSSSAGARGGWPSSSPCSSWRARWPLPSCTRAGRWRRSPPRAGPSLLVAVGALSVSDARHALSDLGPTVGFLAALLVLAEGCRREGLFDAMGGLMAAGARGSPRRLLALVFAVATTVTAVLSLDATVVLLTPIVFATAARLRTSPRPHVYACSHLANSASLLLPVSNLTNLLAFHASGLSFMRFAGLMALPTGAAVAVEWVVLTRFFAVELHRPRRAQADEGERPALPRLRGHGRRAHARGLRAELRARDRARVGRRRGRGGHHGARARAAGDDGADARAGGRAVVPGLRPRPRRHRARGQRQRARRRRQRPAALRRRAARAAGRRRGQRASSPTSSTTCRRR